MNVDKGISYTLNWFVFPHAKQQTLIYLDKIRKIPGDSKLVYKIRIESDEHSIDYYNEPPWKHFDILYYGQIKERFIPITSWETREYRQREKK